MHALPPPCHPGTDRKPTVPVRRSFPQARAAVEGSGIPAVCPSSPPWLFRLTKRISRGLPHIMHAARVRVEGPRHIGRRLGRHRSEFLGLSYERDGLIAPIGNL